MWLPTASRSRDAGWEANARLARVQYESTSAGFSLMEVLVGVAILGIAYVMLFGLIYGALRNVDRVGEREKILRLGQMKLNELAILAGQGKWAPQQAGRFDDQLRWNAATSLADFAEEENHPQQERKFKLARIHLSVNWQRQGQERNYQLDTAVWLPQLPKESE